MGIDATPPMAYRGGETDPLEVIIQQRRVSRGMILILAAVVVLPGLLQMDFSVWRGIFTRPPTPAATPGAAEPTMPGSKMSAKAVEQLLARSITSSQAPMDPSCLPVIPAPGGWDYVCSYRPSTLSPGRLKIGVRVSSNSILQASPAMRFETPLPSPSQGR